METAVELLRRVTELVGGDRAAQHGDKYENHQNIAALWNAFLDNRVAGELRASEVALMMALLKIARTQSGAFNADDFLDLAGYAAVAFECALRERADLTVTLSPEDVIAAGQKSKREFDPNQWPYSFNT